MFVVMRKFPGDKEWNICGVFSDKEAAVAQIVKEEKTGRESVYCSATHVWIAENGNHSWTS